MSKKLYWGVGILIVLFVGFLFYVQYDYGKFMDSLDSGREKSDPDDTAVSESPEGGEHVGEHEHADGTFHEGGPEEPLPGVEVPAEVPDPPKVQYTAPKGAVLTPEFPEMDPKADPVKAAYKRLEYIKNNPYAWGGVHSERATELIDQLMTESGPIRLIDHNHGDEVFELIDELCRQGDPRAAEVLIAHMCDGDLGGRVMADALAAIGPPAVPYILPYLTRDDTKGSDWIYIYGQVFESLARIGVQYRDDLGGILDHIIIPKFKEIAADEDNKRYRSSSVVQAREALEQLQ